MISAQIQIDPEPQGTAIWGALISSSTEDSCGFVISVGLGRETGDPLPDLDEYRVLDVPPDGGLKPNPPFTPTMFIMWIRRHEGDYVVASASASQHCLADHRYLEDHLSLLKRFYESLDIRSRSPR